MTNDPTASRERAEPYAWYALALLVLVYVLNFIDRQVLSILANDIKADLHISDADLGFLYGTAFAIFYALFGIPLGRLADSWRRTSQIGVGLALWSIMTVASGFATSRTALTAARIGVGVGEASASPAAYSLISDLFPKRIRGTALAIYSSGLYLGGGLSLLIGGEISERWNAAFPHRGPLGLAGWQAAFLAVGLPGLILAAWVATLREPARGAIDGLAQGNGGTQPGAAAGGLLSELLDSLPPLTLIGAMRQGPAELAVNLTGLGVIATVATLLIHLLGPASAQQWGFEALGFYAVFSWARALRQRDPATFALIWGSPAFLAISVGYGMVSLVAYAASVWGAPYAERMFAIPKVEIGWLIGAPGALAGFLGVIIGGAAADALHTRSINGRLWVVVFGLIAPVPALIAAYHATSFALFAALSFVAVGISASALGAAGAASQALVLPRMRGTATATLFLATTLLGLALGPFLAGYVSSTHHDDLAHGVLATLAAVPVGIAALAIALKSYPAAISGLEDRARSLGEMV